MIKGFRKVAARIIALSVIFTSIPAVQLMAGTNDDKAIEGLDMIAQQFRENEGEDPYAFRKSNKGEEFLINEVFPESYDLRNVDTDNDGEADTSYVTPVKSQDPFPTCWGFAATAAAESSILSSGIAGDEYAAQSSNGKELNLSEKHTSFFVMRPVSDPNNSQYGEGYIFDGEKGSSKIYQGGFSFYATSLYASGVGPVLESENKQFEYHGKKENKVVDEDGKPVYYSDDDDWWIDDDLKDKQSFVLKESYILPETSKCINSDKYKSEDERQADFNDAVKAVKEQIYKKRPVQVGYKADVATPGEDPSTEYISDKWAHYTYEDKSDSADHAVLIVGWDDNYPRENFAHKIADGTDAPLPDNDGAWLVKNSWGSEEEEFPNRGYGDWGLLKGEDEGYYNETTGKWEYTPYENAVHTGYFWLSYEDRSINGLEALAFDNVKKDENIIAQYDYMPVVYVFSAYNNSECKTANVFEISKFTDVDVARLSAVSCQTETPGTKVHYSVYRLKDGAAKPTDGKLIAEKDVTYDFGGFHKEELEESVKLQKGDRFSVVVSQTTPDDYFALSMKYATNKKWYDEVGKKRGWTSYAYGVINPGESLFYTSESDTWYDLSEKAVKDELFKYMEEDSEYCDMDNFPIKAYLTETDEKPEKREDDENDKTDEKAEKKEVDKRVPLTGNGDSFASSEDNFAAITSSGKINDQKLDFANVAKSNIDPSGLKMTAIKGSKFTTVGKVKDASSVRSEGGVKVKVNKKTLIAKVTCKSSGSATFTMEDGKSYTIAFTVEKPKAVASAKKMSKGSEKVSRSIKDLFGTDVDGGTLSIKKDIKNLASISDNTLVINPADTGNIKIGYKYLNKNYKMTIKIK